MIYLFTVISIFIWTFGMAGNGTWSRGLTIVGANLCIIAVIWGFFHFSLLMGFVFLIGLLLFSVILLRVMKLLLNPHR